MPDNKNNNINPKDDVENLNFDDDSIDIELEDLTLDDGKVDLKIDSIKPAGDVSVNPASSVSDASASEGAASTTGASSDSSTPAQEANSDASAPTASSTSDISSTPDLESSGNDFSNINDGGSNLSEVDQGDSVDVSDDNFDTGSSDPRSIKDKFNDAKNDIKNAKENLNKAKDNIKNAPKKLKDAKDKAKNNINKAKNNIKNAPDNLRKKREALRNKWNNRPRNAKEFRERLKDNAKNLGENLKNVGKNAGKNIKNGIKNSAKNTFNNSKLGRAIDKGKKAVKAGKKIARGVKKVATGIKALISFLSTPVGIGILIILLLVIAGVILASVFGSTFPGIGGAVSDEENYSKYSEVDQKTIDKLKDISDDYSNANPALAMVAVVYPYIEELHDGDVAVLLGKADEEPEEDLNDEAENEEDDDSGSDTQDLEDDVNDLTPDDPYLEPFRKWSYRRKFKNLLKETRNGEEAFINYLKNDYFKSDNGYEEMFSDSDNDDALADAIVEDLLDLEPDFEAYFFEVCITSDGSMTYLNAAGGVEGFTGDIYVTLRDYRSTNGSFKKDDYYASPVLYNTDSNPLPFSKYIMGVVYAEKGESCVTNEVCAKTLMITAKSFALGRQKTMGYDYEVDESANRTIIHMRGNVGDQDFCDVYEGCQSGTYAWSTRTVMEGSGNPKPALTTEQITQLESWWNDIADEYVIKKSDNSFAGSQYNDYNSNCKVGSCVSQKKVGEASETETDYKNVLYNSSNGGFDNTKYVAYFADSDGIYAVSTGEQICSDGTMTASRQEIVDFARSMVGKIPYYFYEGQNDGYGALGHAISKNFDDNHFGEEASISDHSGRNKYGLDCSGFVDFVFWNVLDNNLGNGNTDTLKSISTEIEYNDLMPGDLGFISNDSGGTEQHVGIYIGDDKWVELNPNGVTEGAYPDFKVYYRLNILAELDAQANVGEMYEDIENGIQGDFFAPIQQDLPIGNKDSTNDNKNHDISVGCGTPVYSPADGTATFRTITKDGKVASYGNEVVIRTTDGYEFILAHLESFVGYNVSYGTESTYPSSCSGSACSTYDYGSREVKKGEMVGTSGTSGNSTGCHLHVEVWHNSTRLEPSDILGYRTG